MKLSPHARERMVEMDVDADEVYDTLRNPECQYDSGPQHPGGQVFVRGRLAVAVCGKWVRTVLWNGRTGRDEAVQ